MKKKIWKPTSSFRICQAKCNSEAAETPSCCVHSAKTGQCQMIFGGNATLPAEPQELWRQHKHVCTDTLNIFSLFGGLAGSKPCCAVPPFPGGTGGCGTREARQFCIPRPVGWVRAVLDDVRACDRSLAQHGLRKEIGINQLACNLQPWAWWQGLNGYGQWRGGSRHADKWPWAARKGSEFRAPCLQLQLAIQLTLADQLLRLAAGLQADCMTRLATCCHMLINALHSCCLWCNPPIVYQDTACSILQPMHGDSTVGPRQAYSHCR